MAASQRPGKRMVSTCSPETERCTLVFEIASYSLHKDLPAGKFIRSAAFAVGRHDWSIRYYPNGDSREDSRDYVSVYLELMSKNTKVTALFDLRLVNQATRLSHVLLNVVKPTVFGGVNPAWGAQDFKKKSEVEASPYLRDDRLVIECDITVIMGTPVSASRTVSDIPMPPSDLADDLGKLLSSKKRSDVTFMVKGEVFQGHKCVIATRSPVFEAELYGPMKEKGRRSITVEDMQPDVFRALLHFIYTDNLPVMDDLEEDESEEMIKHLLVAADRYAMERMKSICESILCERLDAESVATTLALADQHHCSKLKDACIGFINSSDRVMDAVVASQGYEHLKTACPTVIAEIWEKAIRSHNI